MGVLRFLAIAVLDDFSGVNRTLRDQKQVVHCGHDDGILKNTGKTMTQVQVKLKPKAPLKWASDHKSNRFAVSTDGETYFGDFATIQEAKEDAMAGGYKGFSVGRCEPPRQPEKYFCVDDWIEQASNDDDYCGEWAEDWYQGKATEEAELVASVRAVMAAWLDKYKLRPRFFTVKESIDYQVIDGVAVETGRQSW